MTDVEGSATYLDLWNAKLRPGDLAPDFELAKLALADGTEGLSGETVRLSAYRHAAPVTLIFGSYT